MKPYTWQTEESHFDNSETMSDYLNNEIDESWSVDFVDGTYAEVTTNDGQKYELHAGGDGDSNNHMIKFEPINT